MENNNIEKSELTNKDQQAIIKNYLWETIVHEYVERRARAYSNDFADNITFSDLAKFELDLSESLDNVLNQMLDTMFGEDEELKFRIFQKFINSYVGLEEETRKEICGYNHTFTEWKKNVGKVPQYDEDGKIISYLSDKDVFERKCTYCGELQRAYSENHKKMIERETDYWANRFPKERRFAKQNVLINNRKKDQQ